MLTTLRELLEQAQKEERGVGSFTCANMEMVMGTIRAAQEGRLRNTPLDYIGPLMVQAAKDAAVSICVHLDHGLTLEKIEEALSYGFTSIMMDGSRLPLSENIRVTNAAAEMARRYGASVEAELGSVGGAEATDEVEQIAYTEVKEAVRFAKEADIDALAVAIGNAHGHYTGTPKLNFERLKELQVAVLKPLVLHGGSGITDDDFRRCIANGIRKVNIATASLDALTEHAREYLSTEGSHNFYRLNDSMVEGVYQNVKHCIRVFNMGGEH